MSQTTVTHGDLLDFILENKGERVFVGWTIDQILHEILRAVTDNSMLFCTEPSTGRLLGVVTGRKLELPDGTKIMHITSLLTTRKGILALFFDTFRNMYPEYKLLTSNRRKKIRPLTQYKNLHKLGKLIERLT